MGRQGRAIGILAYGSLGGDPGVEIGPLVVEKIEGVETPFRVEFVRESKTRDGAPTLAPVSEGGAAVYAGILVLQNSVSEHEATDILWRRETRKEGSEQRYNPSSEVTVRRLENFEGLDVVLYVEVHANITTPDPRNLAELATRSARSDAGRKEKDGITYLMNAKKNGVETLLMPGYEEEILRLTGADTLEQAHAKLTTQKP
ncbi:MAG: hypothetical protein WA990_11560 [Rubrobacteraceae bacterium]